MYDSVIRKVLYDSAKVLQEMLDVRVYLEPDTPGETLWDVVREMDTYFDIGTGEGPLLGKVLDAFAARDFLRLGSGLALLCCPFHLSEALFVHAWHKDYDGHLECVRRDLPFVYKRDEELGQVDKRALKMWLQRTSVRAVETVVEAYKYGNGFPVLRARFLNDHYDRMVNVVVAGWVRLLRDEKAEGSPPDAQ